ncbi:MAG: [protein-PII] uridylyltransferase [Hasllibacter sp.]
MSADGAVPVADPAAPPPATARDLAARLLDGTAGAEDPPAAARAFLRGALREGREALERRLAEAPRDARPVVEGHAALTDEVVRAALAHATALHPNGVPSEGERLAVLAVGGYGRGEMAPHSDVDLLFLTPWKVSGWQETVIETVLYLLWDLKLKVGHATRTVKECLRLGREDFTIRTALLEHRPVAGDAPLAAELSDRLRRDLFRGTEREFVEAKLEERRLRLARQGNQRYRVEPNVKEGKGGLRDLHSLYWMAKYVHDAPDGAALVARGIFRPSEQADFDRAHGFLWAVRCHMHLAAGRAVEQLTFDLQVEVAERMGYADRPGRRGVERLMQDYFRHATAVGELTRILLQALEADEFKSEPLLQRLLPRRRRVRPPFTMRYGRLALGDEGAFLADPLNLMRLFEEALRTGLLIDADALRLVKDNLPLVAALREDRAAQRVFLDTILRHGNPERALRRMNEIGALAAFLPEFEPVACLMQYNMYHSYTVDEHSIQAVATLAMIEKGELVEALPVASGILRAGVARRALYLAVLLHDIGKGREEDHSVLGARIARGACQRLALPAAEAETVEWLVRHHLLMSDTAQKRDLSEPRTIGAFAKQVGTRARLDLLTVLTVCDIRAVGPGTWNNWKAQLIRRLHRETAAALDGAPPARAPREAEAKRALRAALRDWPAADLRAETARHYGPYWQNLPTEAHVRFAGMLRGLGNGDIRMEVDADPDRDATRLAFALPDHPGIFSRLAGALALTGAEVVDATTFTTKDGFATAAFWVQDGAGAPYDETRLPRLRRAIGRILKGEVVVREALAPKDQIKKREKGFRVPTVISFDNEASDLYTLVEVDTRDRPGLLHDLTRTLADSGLTIASAVIATYGEQAVDTFYVKDLFGLKLHEERRRRALEKRLREAIEKGAARAAG